jgi:HK97 gp10 family phage protein
MTNNDVNIDLVGDEELMKVLTSLPYKLQQKTLKKITNNAARTLVSPLRSEIPKRQTNLVNKGANKKFHPPGLGKKSIGTKYGKSRKSAVVFLGPKGPKGDYMRDPWYLKFFEYGARGKNRNLIIAKFFERRLKDVEDHMAKSIRTILTKEFNKLKK